MDKQTKKPGLSTAGKRLICSGRLIAIQKGSSMKCLIGNWQNLNTSWNVQHAAAASFCCPDMRNTGKGSRWLKSCDIL